MAETLPSRTTLQDVVSITGYLANKPMGAMLAEAKSVLDESVVEPRKMSAYRFWGLIEEAEGRLKVTDLGRLAGKNRGQNLAVAMQQVVREIPAYVAIIERASHRGEHTYSAIEVATHWHEHFRNVASQNEQILNHQAVCFFQIAQGAEFGTMVVGRKGQPTRFEFSDDGLLKAAGITSVRELTEEDAADVDMNDAEVTGIPPAGKTPSFNNKVFITHGKNKTVLEQIKKIVSFGPYEPVIAAERESLAKPVPDKVMDDMRACSAAVIHVSSEGTYKDASGKEKSKINDNVLIEIGAAMALYKKNFILVVEEGLELPSNLQGLYQCRYTGNELGMEATMKLLEAFKQFRE